MGGQPEAHNENIFDGMTDTITKMFRDRLKNFNQDPESLDVTTYLMAFVSTFIPVNASNQHLGLKKIIEGTNLFPQEAEFFDKILRLDFNVNVEDFIDTVLSVAEKIDGFSKCPLYPCIIAVLDKKLLQK